MDKVVQQVRRRLVNACQKNYDICARIGRAKKQLKIAIENENKLLVDIYATELECLVESYEKNGKILQESVTQLDLNDSHKWN